MPDDGGYVGRESALLELRDAVASRIADAEASARASNNKSSEDEENEEKSEQKESQLAQPCTPQVKVTKKSVQSYFARLDQQSGGVKSKKKKKKQREVDEYLAMHHLQSDMRLYFLVYL